MHTDTNTPRRSAAGIKIVKPPTDRELFPRLRAFMTTVGPNKHDRAICVIVALIDEGLNTSPRIIGALKRLGFNARHAGMLLHEGTGTDPDRHRWSKDGEGRYSLLM